MKAVIRMTVIAIAILSLGVVLTASAGAQAADLYKTKCQSCHAADGTGNTPVGTKMGVKSFAAPEVAKATDDQWFEATKKGKGKMPAYDGKLTDDQIKELIKFCRTLGK